jgi:hypothetical protein
VAALPAGRLSRSLTSQVTISGWSTKRSASRLPLTCPGDLALAAGDWVNAGVDDDLIAAAAGLIVMIARDPMRNSGESLTASLTQSKQNKQPRPLTWADGARREGFEPPTARSVVWCSIR